MSVWDVLSWIANCQLVLNDVNIIGVVWAVGLTLFGYTRFRAFQQRGFASVGVEDMESTSPIIPFLVSIVFVVWIQSVIDLGVITPIAILFGRWSEMDALLGPLTIWSFCRLYWNVIATIGLLGGFLWQKKLYRLFHFTKQSGGLLIAMVVLCITMTAIFGVWQYNRLTGTLRTTYFWSFYPPIRLLWGLFLMSLLKKPHGQIMSLSVKDYYVAGEHYDWVTDPRCLEKVFHAKREQDTVKFINKYASNSTILDVGCGTGRITRNLQGDVVGLDINAWNIARAKVNAPNATFLLGDCEDMTQIDDASVDLVVCTETLEHLVDPQKTLCEIHRVLKRHGKAIITVPSNLFIWKLRRYLTTTHPHNEPFHRNFSKNEFRTILHNFKVLELKTIVFGLTLLAVLEKAN